jgi:hypothetical protein
MLSENMLSNYILLSDDKLRIYFTAAKNEQNFSSFAVQQFQLAGRCEHDAVR